MSADIAVIHVPVSEWNDIKNQLKDISKGLMQLNNKGQKEMITVNETLELLKCSRNTLQSYINKGFFTPIKMKSEKYSKLLFRRSDIDFYIQSRCN